MVMVGEREREMDSDTLPHRELNIWTHRELNIWTHRELNIWIERSQKSPTLSFCFSTCLNPRDNLC